MPKVQLFGICQKAIVDQNDQSITMVALLGNLNIQTSFNEPVLENTMLPFPWAVVCSWIRTESDSNITFESKIELISPSGKIAMTALGAPFSMIERNMQSVISGIGIPLTEAGVCEFKLFIRPSGTIDWVEMSSYSFEMRVEIQSQPVSELELNLETTQ